MNIFIVDRNPTVAAKMLCDQHVVKMVTEGAQMLSTCHRVLDGKMAMGSSNSGKRQVPRYTLDDSREDLLYHAVHFQHPCNIWIREDVIHYEWLVLHTLALSEEYTKRFRKTHACHALVKFFVEVPSPINMPRPLRGDVNGKRLLGNHPFVQAMPDEYKDADPVKAYRNFYIGGKSKFARWRFTTPPKWYTDATAKSVRSVSTLRGNQESLSH